MTKWLWYLGWPIVWILLHSFIFVPLSNQFKDGGALGGVIRGLILTSGALLLVYGFRVIYRMPKAREERHADHAQFGTTSEVMGMSEREAALVAEARQAVVISQAPVQSSVRNNSAQPPANPSTPIAMAPNVVSELGKVTANQAVSTGVMKAAGNPLVRKAFAQAMKEVETKTYDSGLWAMALVECNGDEHSARIAYMKARATDLAWSNAKAAEAAEPLKKTL